MLSPASLRVCCLTVMAPALTKADRRADCLPVVLSDSFCAFKTSDSQNSEDRINTLSATKSPCKSAFLIRRRKTWLGTSVGSTIGFFPKIRFSAGNPKFIFDNSSIRANADVKSKIWQSTKVTTALADRAKLKYTMSKNNSSIKNMGLAKANTSLGLQNLKKMNKVSQCQNEEENPLRLLDVGDSSPDLPDSTNSELQSDLTITEIFKPIADHAAEDVVSSSDGDVFVPCSSSKTEVLPSVFDNATGTATATCTNSILTSSVSDCAIPPPLTCSSQLTVQSSVSDSVSLLPVTLKVAGENGSSSSCSLEDKSVALSSVPLSVDLPCADVDVPSITSGNHSPLRVTHTVLGSSNLVSKESFETNTSKCSVSNMPVSSSAVMSPLSSSSSSTDGLMLSLASEANPEAKQLKTLVTEMIPADGTSALAPDCNLVVSSEDIVTEPLKYSASDLSLPSANTSTSETSEDCLKLPPFTDETLEIFTIPEALQNPINSVSLQQLEASKIYFNASLVELGLKISTSVPIVDSCSTTKKVLNYENSLVPNIGKQAFCCPPTLKDLKLIEKLYLDIMEKTNLGKEQSLLLLSKHMIAHVKKELRNFVEHYQRKFNIPCQRQVRNSNSKPGKELVDLKAELLQSEDVKNLSTAALVSLVRKLESSGSPGKLLPQQSSFSQNSELASAEGANVTFDPEEYADIKHTSNMLLTSMRNLLKSVDSDETDDSDEDSAEEKKIEAFSPFHKILYGKYLKKRASLERRSTWLLSRIHEIEYMIRILNGVLKKECLVEGDVCFVNQARSVSIDDLDNATEQTTAVKTKVKSLIKQVNGYLDHSSINSAVCVARAEASSSHSVHFEKDSTHAPHSVVEDDESCSRTRPLKTSSFRKRKFLPTTGLHLTNNKLSRLSTISCDCNSQNVMHPCILCTGRYNCKQSVDPDSMPLPDRIALLDPTFHPVLSFEKDIPWELHVGAVFKKTESRYQPVQPLSPISNQRRLRLGVKAKHFSDARSHTRKLNRYARSLLSAKYRNKHVRSTKHLRKHGLIFGKWRRLQNKSFHMRERMRRISVASSASSRESPVPSPFSLYEDGFDQSKKRKDDNQFDIDDVIIPCSSKSGRLVDIQYKEILIPSWRYREVTDVAEAETVETEEIEDISDDTYIKRHEKLEVEEKKMLRSSALGLTGKSRRGRRHRCDSRADSSGANTPDPVLLYNQDIMFQVPNSIVTAGPSSPAASPPTTPSSITVMSDDSQPPYGNGSLARFEKRKFAIHKKTSEENAIVHSATNDCDDVQPYEPHKFPLSDKEYEQLLAESTHLCTEDTDMTLSVPSFPASPESSTSSTSTVEEDEDITDPEWTVVKRDNGPDQALVLKFAKR